jgi:hypothetical protein
LALDRIEDVMALFAHARAATADQLVAFELIPRDRLDLALAHVPGILDPLASRHPWYAFLEMSSSRSGSGLRELLERRLLEAVLAHGLVADGIIAASEAHRRELWRIREGIVEAQLASGSIKHDLSIPVSRVAEFVIRASDAVAARLPGIGRSPLAMWRRQHPLQPDAAGRCRPRRVSRALAGVQRPRARRRARPRRLCLRRARRWQHEVRRDHPLQAGGLDRVDALGQACPRSRQHHELGKLVSVW